MASGQSIGRDFASEQPKGRDFAAESSSTPSAPAPELVDIKNRNEYSKALMPDGVAVFEGIASWCPECKTIAPLLIKLVKKYPEVRFYRYNVETADDVAHELGATHTPKFSLFVDGMLEDGMMGGNMRNLEKMIQQVYKGNIVE